MHTLDPQERAVQVLRALVASAVDGIIVIDARGRIETFNPAAERLFGYAEQDVMGRNVNMLMPSPYREEHDRYLWDPLASAVTPAPTPPSAFRTTISSRTRSVWI